MSKYIMEMRNITKLFPGVKALDNVSFKVEKGEIHFLCGENGAGKSTLMKVLSGVYSHDSFDGDIVINDEVRKFKTISDSEKIGVAIIYQELTLVPEMTVQENIFLGHELKHGITIDKNQMISKTNELLQTVGLDIKFDEKIKNLGVGKQQLVEIAKALSKDVSLLILDEPTAALNEDDSENLLELIKKLQAKGVTCIMISHKLKEVISIAETVTVLRDGQTICTLIGDEITENNIIKNMVGRHIENIYPKRENKIIGETIFEVKNLDAYSSSKKHILKDISFNVSKGEIVGISGLMGAGRTELALSIFGNYDDNKVTGEIYVENNLVKLKNASDAINNGIAYVTEDRKGNGLILPQMIIDNITIVSLDQLAKYGVINKNEEVNVTNHYLNKLKIKAPSITQKVEKLSGGNQQKVSLAKWLYSKPKVLILDEPTRGIDVGAKFEIYTLMNELVEQGMSIIMISSELLEVIGMSDRVYVLAEGEVKGELTNENITEENIMKLSTL